MKQISNHEGATKLLTPPLQITLLINKLRQKKNKHESSTTKFNPFF